MTPEQRLWQAVLGQAISDAMMEDPQTLESMMDKKSARSWFDFADRNFRWYAKWRDGSDAGRWTLDAVSGRGVTATGEPRWRT